MAIRLNQAVVKGWIDNTTPGITTGSIEILGLNRPLRLYLKGNTWRDLAGTKIYFRNPNPMPQPREVEHLQPFQRGVVGDMSASQKVKELLLSQQEAQLCIDEGKPVPFVWKNNLYLEWYSLTNGRVLLETTQFEITPGLHQWEVDAKGDLEQKLQNVATVRHFMEIMLNAAEAEADTNFAEDEADEFEWERRLRVRDTLEEAAWLIEGTNDSSIEVLSLEHLDPRLQDRAPLVRRSFDVQSRTLEALGGGMLDEGPRGDLALSVAYVFDSLDEVYPKITVLLENGYLVAILKRTLDACNRAIASCNTLAMEDDQFEGLRAHIFSLRNAIFDESIELRTHL